MLDLGGGGGGQVGGRPGVSPVYTGQSTPGVDTRQIDQCEHSSKSDVDAVIKKTRFSI